MREEAIEADLDRLKAENVLQEGRYLQLGRCRSHRHLQELELLAFEEYIMSHFIIYPFFLPGEGSESDANKIFHQGQFISTSIETERFRSHFEISEILGI